MRGVVIVALVVAALVGGSAALLLYSHLSGVKLGDVGKTSVTYIPSNFTATPVPKVVVPTATPTPLPPGAIRVGHTAVVTGVGTAGLRMHVLPASKAIVTTLANAAQVQVLAGPKTVAGDANQWWEVHLASPDYTGWVAGAYLQGQ